MYTCETCDVIFCVLCQNGASHKAINEESKNCEHTVIPYAVAIKRMAEILIYKANECLAKVSVDAVIGINFINYSLSQYQIKIDVKVFEVFNFKM